MQITFQDHELVFLYGKDIKVKSITPRGEYEFTILFEQDVKPTSSTYEITRQHIETTSHACVESSEILNYEQQLEDDSPSVEDIVDYLRSREHVGYDNAILQEHFLGRMLDSRDDTVLYHRLKDITRKAMKITENEDNGVWKEKGYRKLGKTRRVKQFIFVNLDPIPVEVISDENEVQSDKNSDVQNESTED